MKPSVLVITTSLALSMQGCPQPWKDKDSTEWTLQDCTRVLYSSPWVHHEYSGVYMQPEDYWREPRSARLIVQLWSALPVQLALTRRSDLARSGPPILSTDVALLSEYDKIQKLADITEDYVVVQYSYKVSYSAQDRRVVTGSAPPPSATVRYRSALFLADGRVILPAAEAPLFQGFQAQFPRIVEGRPIHELSGTHLVFAVGRFSATESQVERRFRFKISDLMYQGRLEY